MPDRPADRDAVAALDAALDANPEFAKAAEEVAALDAQEPPDAIDHRDLVRRLRASG